MKIHAKNIEPYEENPEDPSPESLPVTRENFFEIISRFLNNEKFDPLIGLALEKLASCSTSGYFQALIIELYYFKGLNQFDQIARVLSRDVRFVEKHLDEGIAAFCNIIKDSKSAGGL